MSIFRHKTPDREHSSPDRAGRRFGERPNWMRNGAQVALLDGSEILEVVGESFHQPDLWEHISCETAVRRRTSRPSKDEKACCPGRLESRDLRRGDH
jgi:hypothetical protein